MGPHHMAAHHGFYTDKEVCSQCCLPPSACCVCCSRSFGSCPLVGGSRNTLALDADGGLWSWGWNDRWVVGLVWMRSWHDGQLAAGTGGSGALRCATAASAVAACVSQQHSRRPLGPQSMRQGCHCTQRLGLDTQTLCWLLPAAAVGWPQGHAGPRPQGAAAQAGPGAGPVRCGGGAGAS